MEQLSEFFLRDVLFFPDIEDLFSDRHNSSLLVVSFWFHYIEAIEKRKAIILFHIKLQEAKIL